MPQRKPRQTPLTVTGRAADTDTERRIFVATDAAIGDEGQASCGFMSGHGHYGLSAHPYPPRVSGPQASTVTELRAVMFALEHLQPLVGDDRPIRILTDSHDALALLRDWRGGGDRMPDGYSRASRSRGEAPTLVALSRRVARQPHVSFRLVTGHAGHPLNEAADSLAKLGLRAQRGVVPVERVPGLAALWAARAQADYAATLTGGGAGNNT